MSSALAPIPVHLGPRTYSIFVEPKSLVSLGERMFALKLGRRSLIVTNPTVNRLYGATVRDSLRSAGFDADLLEIPDGEEHKNLAWLTFLYERLVEARLDRGSCLVALGGGVIGDLTGFAAATYLRGIAFVQVPTTLLAQVDASIGGKTGVNLAAGKNLIGAFHHPRLVLSDVETLRSLPRREYLAGVAEVIKYGAILSPELFDLLEAKLPELVRGEPTILAHVVHASSQLKALVVSEDERESDYRAILNFGHTLGHAIESLTEYREFLHGEAVAIGMAFAARLSAARGLLEQEKAQRLVRLIERAGLPTEIPEDLRPAALALAVETDKKRNDGKVKFVCLEDLGKTCFQLLGTKELEAAIQGI